MMYESGVGLKIAIRVGEKVLNSVLFKNNGMKSLMEMFEVGETIKFKAVVVNEGPQHDLVKIFAVKI